MNELEINEMLYKIAIAIEREYGCGGCPYEDRCFVKTNGECIGKIKMWLESIIE